MVAACFARVNIEECKFSGVAAQDSLLPGVATKIKPFDDLAALIAHWQSSLQAIALEIKNGVAGVVFENENDLIFCEVKPLLRLPERQLQYEMLQLEQLKQK